MNRFEPLYFGDTCDIMADMKLNRLLVMVKRDGENIGSVDVPFYGIYSGQTDWGEIECPDTGATTADIFAEIAVAAATGIRNKKYNVSDVTVTKCVPARQWFTHPDWRKYNPMYGRKVHPLMTPVPV